MKTRYHLNDFLEEMKNKEISYQIMFKHKSSSKKNSFSKEVEG